MSILSIFYTNLAMEDEVARYMQLKFLHMTKDLAGPVVFPPSWSLNKLMECDHAVRIITAAIRNPRESHDYFLVFSVQLTRPVSLDRLEWDIDRYCDYLTKHQSGGNNAAEAELETRFKPIPKQSGSTPLLDVPGVLTDRHGVALVWHLPGLITEARHQQLWAAGLTLEPHLQIVRNSKNWRIGPEFFKPADQCNRRPGTVTMSPAWFQQGHDVSSLPANLTSEVNDNVTDGRMAVRDISHLETKSWRELPELVQTD